MAVVPGIPGCVSSDETIEEAKDRCKEAIVVHLEGMDVAERDRIPAPRSRAAVLADEEDLYIEDFIVEVGTTTH
ncbi:MAG: type II toxin-antitoxin system HicB family antitoxin [Parasphingorhabdus sp.]